MISGVRIGVSGSADADRDAPPVLPITARDARPHALIVATPDAGQAPGRLATQVLAEMCSELSVLWPSECERLACLHTGGLSGAAS